MSEMPEQDEYWRQTAVIAIRHVSVCVRLYCDISFLRNGYREVVGRDNRHCRVDGGYKSLWLNLWMIGIRGARGRMCALRSDPAGHHASPLTTLLSSNRESETETGQMIPNAKRTHNQPHCTQLACLHDVDFWRRNTFVVFFFLRCRHGLFFFSLYGYHMNAALTDESTTAKQCRGLWYRLKMQLIKFQESMWWFWLHLRVLNSISSRATQALWLPSKGQL